MTLVQFRQALMAAFSLHLRQAKVTVTESRDISLACKAELSAEIFISVYFNALTSKTSYALICRDQRLTGYDSYRFWHHHPFGATDQHIPCLPLRPDEAIAELAEAAEMLTNAT